MKTGIAKTSTDNLGLVIRPATAGDSENLIKYTRSIATETDYLTFSESEFNPSVQEEAEFLEGIRKSNNQLFLLACVNQQIVGTLSLTGSSRARLQHNLEVGVSVSKKYWGNGISKSLLSTAHNFAEANSVVHKVYAIIRADNAPALKLFRDSGYVKEGTFRDDVKLAGQYYDSHYLARIFPQDA